MHASRRIKQHRKLNPSIWPPSPSSSSSSSSLSASSYPNCRINGAAPLLPSSSRVKLPPVKFLSGSAVLLPLCPDSGRSRVRRGVRWWSVPAGGAVASPNKADKWPKLREKDCYKLEHAKRLFFLWKEQHPSLAQYSP